MPMTYFLYPDHLTLGELDETALFEVKEFP